MSLLEKHPRGFLMKPFERMLSSLQAKKESMESKAERLYSVFNSYLLVSILVSTDALVLSNTIIFQLLLFHVSVRLVYVW